MNLNSYLYRILLIAALSVTCFSGLVSAWWTRATQFERTQAEWQARLTSLTNILSEQLESSNFVSIESVIDALSLDESVVAISVKSSYGYAISEYVNPSPQPSSSTYEWQSDLFTRSLGDAKQLEKKVAEFSVSISLYKVDVLWAEMLFQVITFVVLSAAIFAAITYALVRKQVFTPLAELQESAEQYTLGERALIEVDGPAEVIGLRKSLNQMIATLADYATVDRVTGLYNREYFSRLLKKSLEKQTVPNLAVLFIDLDHFKNVNDNHGHLFGDRLLCAVSNRLKDFPFINGPIGRFGGDEFVVLIDLSQSNLSLSAIGAGVVRAIREDYHINGQRIRITASAGGVCASKSMCDVSELLAAADIAVYEAKRTGRNRFSSYQERLKQQASLWLNAEESLMSHLSKRDVMHAAQPIVGLSNNQVFAHELLLRMNLPSGGTLPPPLAVEVAALHNLNQALAEASLINASRSQKYHHQHHGWPVRATFNLSVSQLMTCNPEKMAELAESLSPSMWPIIEITEEACFGDSKSIDKISHLRENGFELALDDFGSGFSNMITLKSKLFRYVKLDKEIIKHVLEQKSAKDLAQNLIKMLNDLGYLVIAEGIEVEQEYDFVCSAGCHFAQGYWVGKPSLTYLKSSLNLEVGMAVEGNANPRSR